MTYHASKVKPGKCIAFAGTIDQRMLYSKLNAAGPAASTDPNKLPKDMSEGFTLVLPAHRNSVFVGLHDVDVIPAVSQGVPRVFVKCACGKRVPFGRVNQHSHDEKFGTVTVAE